MNEGMQFIGNNTLLPRVLVLCDTAPPARTLEVVRAGGFIFYTLCTPNTPPTHFAYVGGANLNL